MEEYTSYQFEQGRHHFFPVFSYALLNEYQLNVDGVSLVLNSAVLSMSNIFYNRNYPLIEHLAFKLNGSC